MTGGDDSRIAALPHLGGKTAVILFVFTLSAFVAESQLTQVRFRDLQWYYVHLSYQIIAVCPEQPRISATILLVVS